MKNKNRQSQTESTLEEIVTRHFLEAQAGSRPMRGLTGKSGDFIYNVETEGESYEQQNYRQASFDIVKLGTVLMDNQKEITCLKEMVSDLEQNALFFQKQLKKTQKKLKKQTKEIGDLQQQNHKQAMKVKKNRQQVKLLTKTVCVMGTCLGLGKASGGLKQMKQSCMNALDAGYMGRQKRLPVVDVDFEEMI